MTDDQGILENIRILMDTGALPVGELSSRRIGAISARICDACNNAIRPTEAAVELQFWETIAVNMHSGCAKLYETELRRRGYASSG